eukprot:scaffold33547_cov129-Isochrysis_galbana.AAC.3
MRVGLMWPEIVPRDQHISMCMQCAIVSCTIVASRYVCGQDRLVLCAACTCSARVLGVHGVARRACAVAACTTA